MWIEFLIAVAARFQVFAAIGLALLGVFFFFSIIMVGDKTGPGPEFCQAAIKLIFKTLIIAIPLIFICLIPDVDDLWRVRIGLIKLQLASPENVQKGYAEIARIAHELECKYLNCKEEK